MNLTSHFGWRPDLPDARDHVYQLTRPTVSHGDPSVDITLKYKQPPIYDQGQLGSCTGNAIAYAIQHLLLNHHSEHNLASITPSRLFIYYNERVMENSVNSDAGAEIRDGIKSVVNIGVCNELKWPYVEGNFANRPNPSCYTEAEKFKAVSYQRLDNTKKNQLLDVLHSGLPFIFGFTCYESFESEEVATTGILPMPNFSTEKVVGGHAVACVGYNAQHKRFIIRNSWGKGWGKNGYFTIPEEYITNTNLADDFWVIKSTL